MGSLFGAIGDAIGEAFDSGAEVIEEGVTAVEEVVSDAVETVGSAAQDGAEAVGDAVEEIPVVGGIASGFMSWGGDVASATADLCGAAIKGFGAAVKGVLGGGTRIIGGILTLNGGLILEGLGDVFSGVFGGILVTLVVGVGWVQTVVVVGQARSRRLNDKERELIQRIYGDSIALYNVRIVQGWTGVFEFGAPGMVVGNTIYFKEDEFSDNLLAHESCHVWQYQNLGSRYMTDALYAQVVIDDHYNWHKEIERGNDQWVDFNREAQGQFFQSVWISGALVMDGGVPQVGNGVFFYADGDSRLSLYRHDHAAEGEPEDLADHTALADEAVTVVRGGRSYRLSQGIS